MCKLNRSFVLMSWLCVAYICVLIILKVCRLSLRKEISMQNDKMNNGRYFVGFLYVPQKKMGRFHHCAFALHSVASWCELLHQACEMHTTSSCIATMIMDIGYARYCNSRWRLKWNNIHRTASHRIELNLNQIDSDLCQFWHRLIAIINQSNPVHINNSL